MEAGVNEDMGEIDERNSLHGDEIYRSITERDTTRMAHEGTGPIPNIGTPSAYYEGNTERYIIISSFHSTKAGKLSEQTLSQLGSKYKSKYKSNG